MANQIQFKIKINKKTFEHEQATMEYVQGEFEGEVLYRTIQS